MTQNPPRMTRSQVQAAYDAEVASIRALRDSGEHQQGISMALNEARRWLDRELDRALPDPLPLTAPQSPFTTSEIPQTIRLGDKLRANLAEAERLRLSAIERADRLARERAAELRQKVNAEFASLKAKITQSIDDGSIPPPLRMSPVLDNKTKWGVSILNKEHDLYDLWQTEMVRWAQAEGLLLQVQHDHDGGGVESWWSVVVKLA